MRRKSLPARAFWIILVAGMVTGMGNGSVFGAALMCFLGRGEFVDWGGWWPLDYNPHTFTGFIDWCMILFGLGYAGMLALALKRHDVLERNREGDEQHKTPVAVGQTTATASATGTSF